MLIDYLDTYISFVMLFVSALQCKPLCWRRHGHDRELWWSDGAYWAGVTNLIQWIVRQLQPRWLIGADAVCLV